MNGRFEKAGSSENTRGVRRRGDLNHRHFSAAGSLRPGTTHLPFTGNSGLKSLTNRKPERKSVFYGVISREAGNINTGTAQNPPRQRACPPARGDSSALSTPKRSRDGFLPFERRRVARTSRRSSGALLKESWRRKKKKKRCLPKFPRFHFRASRSEIAIEFACKLFIKSPAARAGLDSTRGSIGKSIGFEVSLPIVSRACTKIQNKTFCAKLAARVSGFLKL